MQERELNISRLLIEAGEQIRQVYENENPGTRLKQDSSPVTEADLASSHVINMGLKDMFPSIPVLDEENPIPDYKIRQNWERYFLLDPLDGTKEFINRNGEFCINLAMIQRGRPDEGWIYQPLLRKGWYGIKGGGIFEFEATGEFEQLHQREGRISETIRVVASRSFFKPLEAALIEEMQKFWPVQIIHKGSSLKQIEIIKNQADMYLKAGPCSEWDTAPGQLFVEEFGGAVLKMKDFQSMRYNKQNLVNPYFVMLSKKLNNSSFVELLKKVMLEIGGGFQS